MTCTHEEDKTAAKLFIFPKATVASNKLCNLS